MIGKIVFLLALTAISATHGVRLAFSGRNLPSMDIFDGAPDAYLILYYAETATSQYVLVGETDNISDNRNPDWPETYYFNYTGGIAQRLKFDMYDADSPDADDYMGYVEVLLADVVNAFGGILTRDLIGGSPGGGQLIIKVQEVVPAAAVIAENPSIKRIA